MAKIIREIDLDLKKDNIQVFQEYVNPLVALVMQELLEIGMEPPRVDVVMENGVYRLLYAHSQDYSLEGDNYGGHHRYFARANWKEGLTPFPCNLWSEHKADPDYWGIDWIDSKNIKKNYACFDYRFFDSARFLSEEALRRLCIRENINMNEMAYKCEYHMNGKTLADLRSEAMKEIA